MQQKPLVSILIPAYNAGEWLADSLRSALAQTWERKEIVVVDDGSKDDTLAVARRFESDTVRVFTKKNEGAAATRNAAFGHSKGDYIQWLDADDMIGAEKVARQMAALGDFSNKRTLVSGGWAQFMYRTGRARFVASPLWADLSPAEWLLRKMATNSHMQTATWLVSRELTETAGPWNTQLLGDDDGEYFCRVLMASDGVRFVPEARVYYRAAPNSLSYIGQSDEKRDAQWVSMELHMRYLRSLEDSERTRAACVTYMRNWMVFFYPERQDIFDKAQAIARNLGGELRPPRLSWKYSWIKALFGWPLARRAQMSLPAFKWSLVRKWDHMQFERAGRRQAMLT